jgi:hypothetical protein
VGVRQRIGIDAAGDQARIVGHIDHQIGAHAVGDLAEAGKVDVAAVGAGAGQDQLRLLLLRHLGHVVVVDQAVGLAHLVGHGPEPLAGLVGGRAVGQVAAGRQIHAQEGVARRQQGLEDRLVGLGPRVRLDVGEGAAEQLFGAVAGQILGHVDIFAAAIVAAARIALGVFVGQDRALRLKHRLRNDVLGGDQLDLLLLTAQLALDAAEGVRIGLGQGFREIVSVGEGGHIGPRKWRCTI